MHRSWLLGALALGWFANAACSAAEDDDGRLDAGEAGAPTAHDGGEGVLDGGDAGAFVVPRGECAQLASIPVSEILPRILSRELETRLDLGARTSKVTLHVNLPADAAIPPPWDRAVPATTSNHVLAVDVFDSLGVMHRLTLYFRRDAPDRWEWHALVDGADIEGGTRGTAFEGGFGTISFEDGALARDETEVSIWNFAAAVTGQEITFDLGPSRREQTGSAASSTQRPGPFTTTLLQQDGSSFGPIARLAFSPEGNVLGIFADGRRAWIGWCSMGAASTP